MLTSKAELIQEGLDTYKFNTKGYTNVSQQKYTDVRISLTYNTPKAEILLIPKYLSTTNYMYISMQKNGTVKVGAFIKGVDKLYGEIEHSYRTTNEIVITNKGSLFSVFIEKEMVFKFQSGLFVSGAILIAADKSESFKSCTIEQEQSKHWSNNVKTKKVSVSLIEDSGMRLFDMTGSTSEVAEVSQSLSLKKGKHFISMKYSGMLKLTISGNGAVIKEESLSAPRLSTGNISFETVVDGNILIKITTQTECRFGLVQVEQNSAPTAYIETSTNVHAERKASLLSFPLKSKETLKAGTFYMKIRLQDDIVINAEQVLFRSNDSQVKVSITSSAVIFVIAGKTIRTSYKLSSQREVEITASWTDNYFYIKANEAVSEAKELIAVRGGMDRIIFADEGSIKSPLILEEWALFNKEIEKENNPRNILSEASIVSLFDGGISGQNVTWTELPVAPHDHSPILVEKEDGTQMEKVSFFSHETGDFITYNKEPILYDGKKDFVEVSYSNLDEDYRDIAITNEKGERIGEPYTIKGKRIYFSLPSYLKRNLRDKVIYARYQVNDTYTIDYNIKAPDGYRIDFAKHDGSRRIVHQEGNRYAEPVKLAKMIEMNPIQNQNHRGFLYVSETVNDLSDFRVTFTPDRLPADGVSSATIVIEPLDRQGNFISHIDLELTADQGFITRHISQDSIEAQKRSGQYLYEYTAPFIKTRVDGELEHETIWIKDTASKRGLAKTMKLRPVEVAGPDQLSRADKESLTLKTTICNYILAYEGTSIDEDQELVNILDLDEDGRITTADINVLASKQMDSSLETIVNRMTRWEEQNNES